jgi:hypothetical protein
MQNVRTGLMICIIPFDPYIRRVCAHPECRGGLQSLCPCPLSSSRPYDCATRGLLHILGAVEVLCRVCVHVALSSSFDLDCATQGLSWVIPWRSGVGVPGLA